ncbi:sensor histidine kinase [Clostridium uliginosum]|uniref:histidine kinase n=1 Tax=Clostridium uliginosum TaxID=119641 RepID=A0A1I1KBF4_9CLOT|nr:HAMP domain-containing sensor histidine kinase [Clostridium uliginosum]SFC56028.1 Signal transduction histidine kinase [Clostridium uliginosum]
MKHSLSKRLFSITLCLISALMILIYILQSFWFEKFYSYRKTSLLVKEISKFQALYSYQINDDYSLYQALEKFENDNNSKVAIFSLNGDLMYLPSKLENKDNVDILTKFCAELINDKTLILDVVNSSKIKVTDFYNKDNDSKKIGIIAPISLKSTNDSVIISVSSIQPIEEASKVINEFLIYLFLGLMIIAIILSSIYSNLISKPLITLNTVANKMSNMDFTVSCPIDREDEIGSLARSLNFLSKNLQSALLDLQKKNKKLEKDIQKERKLENMRKEFVADVSHELKTPIGIIEGYAEGIKDGIVSGNDAMIYLDTIISESKKMSVLVTNMLELSKLESGTIKPNPESFNINRLINKILKNHSLYFEENNLKVNFTSSNPYSYVYADTFQMEQVLTNLITNAIKYTPSGNSINVSIYEENDKFKISIQNTGINIPEEEIDKLFDKFYRIDKSRERHQNSTGLGLSIVKNILNLHNSDFSLQNIPNGVEFYFYLNKIISTDSDLEV